MNKEQLIQYYHRFCRWQQAEPRYVNRHEGEVRHCHNCGTEFSDNFCPRCGQRAEVGRVGWRSIRESITLLWGLDSRSLGYTLVQLLGRPGYLVRDYISGHRQVSFPPVKMLVLVCLSVVIFESVFPSGEQRHQHAFQRREDRQRHGMDQCPEELGHAALPVALYPAHVAGVPLRPGLSAPHIA